MKKILYLLVLSFTINGAAFASSCAYNGSITLANFPYISICKYKYSWFSRITDITLSPSLCAGFGSYNSTTMDTLANGNGLCWAYRCKGDLYFSGNLTDKSVNRATCSPCTANRKIVADESDPTQYVLKIQNR